MDTSVSPEWTIQTGCPLRNDFVSAMPAILSRSRSLTREGLLLRVQIKELEGRIDHVQSTARKAMAQTELEAEQKVNPNTRSPP